MHQVRVHVPQLDPGQLCALVCAAFRPVSQIWNACQLVLCSCLHRKASCKKVAGQSRQTSPRWQKCWLRRALVATVKHMRTFERKPRLVCHAQSAQSRANEQARYCTFCSDFRPSFVSVHSDCDQRQYCQPQLLLHFVWDSCLEFDLH